MRASSQLPGVAFEGDMLRLGHSQGGHATLWAADLAADYAPELTLVAVAALSAAWDPLALAQGILSGTQTPIQVLATSYVTVPYAQTYPDISLDELVAPAARPIVEQFADRCATSPTTIVAVLSALAATAYDPTPMFTLDLDSGPVHDRLSQNIAAVDFDAPLFLGQGTDDEVVPISLQRTLAERLCESGADVAVHEHEGYSHMGVVSPESPLTDDLFDWLDEVEAGTTKANCPS